MTSESAAKDRQISDMQSHSSMISEKLKTLELAGGRKAAIQDAKVSTLESEVADLTKTESKVMEALANQREQFEREVKALKNQAQVDNAELQAQLEEKDETIAELTEEITKFADDVE